MKPSIDRETYWRWSKCRRCQLEFRYLAPRLGGRPKSYCDSCRTESGTGSRATFRFCEDCNTQLIGSQRRWCTPCAAANKKARERDASAKLRWKKRAEAGLEDGPPPSASSSGPKLCGCNQDYMTMPIDHECEAPTRR